MSESLGDVGLSHPDGAVQDDGLAGVEEAQGGQVTDVGSRDLRVVGEVVVLDGVGGLEPGSADPADDPGGVAAGQLVFAEGLEELDVAELTGMGLGEAGLDRVEHP